MFGHVVNKRICPIIGRVGIPSRYDSRRWSILQFANPSFSSDGNIVPRSQERSCAVKEALVVGGGVAGLTAAACLTRIGLKVTIAAGDRSDPHHDVHQNASLPTRNEETYVNHVDAAVGIWNHGLEGLEMLGVLGGLEANGRYMTEAGYRESAGTWLAKPSRPLRDSCMPREAESGGDVRILFVRESTLLQALRSCIPDDVHYIGSDIKDLRSGDDDIAGGDAIDGVGKFSHSPDGRDGRPFKSGRTSGIMAHMSKSNTWFNTSADVVVGADGSHSLVRRSRFSNSNEENQSASSQQSRSCGPGACEPLSRGYTVYRGICTVGGVGLQSFQTWGAGLRFASVPLAGRERMWFATVANSIRRTLSWEVRNPGEVKTLLLSLFEDWHDPIRSLLEATSDGDLLWEQAEAMTTSGLKIASDAALSSRSGSDLKGWEGRSVLIGDAAHTLDPVLAQGAGVAIEDAFILADSIKKFNDAVGETRGEQELSPARVDNFHDLHDLHHVLRRFEANRLQRALVLSDLSNLSQFLGQLGPPSLTRVRNSIFALVPSFVKSRMFDGFMTAALAGNRREAIGSALLNSPTGYRIPRPWR